MEGLEKYLHDSGHGNVYGRGYGTGFDDGSGDGYGRGDGSGSGFGDGSGDGSGSGSGSYFGNGYGDSGYGSGGGSGSYFGNGYDGSGDDNDNDIKSINGLSVYMIDSIPTVITRLKNNIAKGYILNKDLTLTPCFIVKQNRMFAHGKTLREAYKSLLEKLFKVLPEEKRIEMFFEQFNFIDKYPAKLFFDWHNRLTGSCLIGREYFVKDKQIDLDNDMFTVAEFVELTKNSYGREIITKLLTGV
jgi:hypothetical protein